MDVPRTLVYYLSMLTDSQRKKLAEKMSSRGRKNIDTMEVVRLYLSGMSSKDVAAELGVSYQTVLVHLRKARDGR